MCRLGVQLSWGQVSSIKQNSCGGGGWANLGFEYHQTSNQAECSGALASKESASRTGNRLRWL